MSLTNKTIANTYKDILTIDNSNNGITTSRKDVKSGDGTTSSMSISDDVMRIVPQNDDTTATFQVNSKGGTELLKVDSTNTAVKTLGQYANTAIQSFGFGSVNSNPTTADTWTMLGKEMGSHRFNSVPITMGTGSTPATTYDVSGGNVAMNLVQSMWYVPFNIAIDSCNVWFGADEASGDGVKFSVMSYTVVTSGGSTGGDLSAGVENCVSPIGIAGAGYEQAYYQALNISTANVDAGKVIVACVHQDGTNSDLTVNMQLVYHLRST
tara:strand:+ start:838 stop:1638 length:801 start_codon:yes stop_codon:yes gene_type:complete